MRKKKKKTTIEKLILGEISSVNKPAQEPALVAIMKNQENDFPELVEKIRKSAGCGKVEALRKARQLHPAEFEAYQATGIEAQVELQKSLNTPLRKRSDFDAAVERMLIDRPQMKRTAAMREVARQQPELFEAHQAA